MVWPGESINDASVWLRVAATTHGESCQVQVGVCVPSCREEARGSFGSYSSTASALDAYSLSVSPSFVVCLYPSLCYNPSLFAGNWSHQHRWLVQTLTEAMSCTVQMVEVCTHSPVVVCWTSVISHSMFESGGDHLTANQVIPVLANVAAAISHWRSVENLLQRKTMIATFP